jgi:hypothetical protein
MVTNGKTEFYLIENQNLLKELSAGTGSQVPDKVNDGMSIMS